MSDQFVSKAVRPPSATISSIDFISLMGLLLCALLLCGRGLQPIHQALWCITFIAAPQMVCLMASGRSLFSTAPKRARDWRRISLKLLGLGATLATLAFAYWLFPEYHKAFYVPFYRAVRLILPWSIPFVVIYVVFVDRRMDDAQDGYWMLGCALLGRRACVRKPEMVQYVLGWIVKGFFLPLMIPYLASQINAVTIGLPQGIHSFSDFYDRSWDVIFLIDLGFVVVGYLATLQLFDSQIQSVEPTVLGWLVGLLPYEPFWAGMRAAFFEYEGGNALTWGAFFRDWPVLYILWGSAILALLVVYAWTTSRFGLRFSNLTHRGIITDGPYRLTKHPHYVCKGLSWWLISIPFIPQLGFAEAIRHSLLLLGVNFIYFMRAWTEERHLSRDPTYVAYALWIEQHGCLRFIRRILPWLAYERLHPEVRRFT